MYILIVRRNTDGDNSLVSNLGVFNTLKAAIAFVIAQRQIHGQYFRNGILKFQEPDAIDAYDSTELGKKILLFYNDDYRVLAEISH